MSFNEIMADKVAEMKKRRRFLEAIAKEIITCEGGIVEEVRPVGLVVRSPFEGSAVEPIYMKVLCQYPSDRGFWLIRGDRDGPTLWAWQSDLGYTKPPIEHSGEAVTVGNSIILPHWLTAMVILTVVVVGIAIVIYLNLEHPPATQ